MNSVWSDPPFDFERWKRCQERFDAANSQILNSFRQYEPAPPALVKEFWGAAADVLDAYHWAVVFEANVTPPSNLFRQLGLIAAELSVGHVPGMVLGVRSRGKAPTGPAKAENLGWAAAYVRLARDGKIADPHPIKTISEKYGVNAHTVRRWAKMALPPIVARSFHEPGFVKIKVEVSWRRHRLLGPNWPATRSGEKRRKGEH